jgi:hypothetical protein
VGASILSNPLTDLRAEVKDALSEAGINAVEYVKENLVPPVAVVVPADPYVRFETGSRFGQYTVSIQVLLIAGKGTNSAVAEKIDSTIVDVLDALQDWDISEVTPPMQLNLKGIAYTGAVVTLGMENSLNKEVM